jgi:hypothetical protein
MDGNPYRSPTTESIDKKRRPSWVGTAVIVLAIVIYGPMTVAPLFRAITGEDTVVMLAVFGFNGVVFLGLIWLGRWLRRRSLRT